MHRIRSLIGVAARLPPALYAATALGWLLSTTLPAVQGDTALCGLSALADGLAAALTLNPPLWLASSWMTMLLAMMPLLMARPLLHLRGDGLDGHHWHKVAAFIAGYGGIWLAVGMILVPSTLLLQTIAGPQNATALALIAIAASLYQATPLKQRCLDGCHRKPALGGFGAGALSDALLYGITHGIWCVGACWALMLLPLAAGAWHLPVMAVVTLVMLHERYRAPHQPFSSFQFRNWALSPRTQR